MKAYICDDSLLFIKTLLWARFGDTSRRTTKLSRNFCAVGLRCEFLGGFFLNTGAFSHWPFATLLLSSVTLSDILAFLLKYLFTFNNIILDLMHMIRCCAL